MKILAVIPARGGSTRIPKKNIKLFLGKPLIAYTIEEAKKVGFIDKIIVSTDSDEIKKVAIKYGAEVPFKRPKNLSTDVPTENVTIHAVEFFKKKNINFDVVLTLEPTHVARKFYHLKEAIDLLKTKKNIDSVMTVTPIKERPEWMWRVVGNKMSPYLKTFFHENKNIMKFPSSKIFKKLYIGSSIVFACRVSALLKYKSCVGINCYPIKITSKYDLDLNWPEDWKKCEIAFKKIR